ncbi:MAG: SDR family NAD(P)-dependent oxidoreductase [Fimbriimonadaceae bacterium]|nr:SDR family NAD(P)-dependent oxidoreductase [Alphaproteobacteria bacterium]
MTKRLDGKVALVTGASRGIGRAVALGYAQEGAHIIAVARTTGALEELDDDIKEVGGSATLVPMSMTDFEAIDRLGGAIFERWKKLDILVGNAGILGPLTPVGHVEPKQWDEVIAVNLTANWRLLRSLDPLLRQSDAGRAVFVTSAAAVYCRAYWGPYSVSKAGLNALVATYANEIQNSNARANVLNPGPVRTKMRAQAMPGEDPQTLPPPEDLTEVFIKMVLPSFEENGVVWNFPTGETQKLTQDPV